MPPKFYKRCSKDGSCDPHSFRTKEGCQSDAMPGDTCVVQKGGGQGNPWVAHVKNFAQRNGMTYPEALKNAECRRQYND